ncbi:MAG: transferase hexapeptide repeat family protein [Saprospiraceae bacterium]|nr:transferase hexapeptide repeat family protein [Saprospiraceae bacterium]
MIYEFEGIRPVIHPTAFIHQTAIVIGHVIIGKDVYIGPGAVLRGDWGCIRIADGCNVQENCVIHMFPGIEVILEAGAHIGHGAVIHGAKIGKNVLIGMNSVIMDEVVIGRDSIVGALSFVKAGEIIPEKSLLAGNPAKIIRTLDEDTISWKKEGTKLYQQLPEMCYRSLKECLPLTEEPEVYQKKEYNYPTLRKNQKER